MAGADLANLVNEAALLAARRNKTAVVDVRSGRGQGQGDARRGAQVAGAHRGGEAPHGLSRSGPCGGGHPDARERSGPQDHHHSAGTGAGTDGIAPRDRPPQLHARMADRIAGHVVRRTGRRGDRVRQERGDHRCRRRHRARHHAGAPDGDPVRDERCGRPDGGGRAGTGGLPRSRVRHPPRDVGADGRAGGPGGQAAARRGLRHRDAPAHREPRAAGTDRDRPARARNARPRGSGPVSRRGCRCRPGPSSRRARPPPAVPVGRPEAPGLRPGILGAPPAKPAGA